ncbi:MAG: radical SAM protein [Candidatus Omnitrophica bacterium]|nr:radical SAM protein [Candidatus Omnitrophota bacterium]
MDYLKEFKINLAYHFSEVLEYPFAKPYWIYVSLSHKCTYKCQMCGVVKILKGYELQTKLIKKALNEINSWNWDCVVMFTGGEPFLREDIFELINYSVNRRLKTEVVSNGALINKEMASRIINSGLQNIAISLDGAKESTHDLIRERGSFKKALDAITNLVMTKKRMNTGPQISVWTTIMKENVQELFEIIDLVKELGVECLVYHPVIVAQDDMQKTSPNAPFWISDGYIKILKEQIDKILDYQSKYGLVAFLHNPYLWLKYFESTLTKKDWKCNPFVFLNIGPDGEVRSCGSSFGNIREMSLDDCLVSKEAFNARRTMKLCQKPCLQTCWAHPESNSLLDIANRFIESIKDNKDKTKFLKETIKILEEYENLLISYKDA